MNGFIDTKFYEEYIKEVPIEEQIKRQVCGELHYMDKADIRKWLEYDEVRIYNLQSKIDKAIELNENIRKKLLTCSSYEKDEVEDLLLKQLDILKEDK